MSVYIFGIYHVVGKDAFGAYGHSVCGELAAKAGGPAMSAIDRGDTFAMFGHAGEGLDPPCSLMKYTPL